MTSIEYEQVPRKAPVPPITYSTLLVAESSGLISNNATCLHSIFSKNMHCDNNILCHLLFCLNYGTAQTTCAHPEYTLDPHQIYTATLVNYAMPPQPLSF